MPPQAGPPVGSRHIGVSQMCHGASQQVVRRNQAELLSPLNLRLEVE